MAGQERSEQTNIESRQVSGEYFYRTDADFVFDRPLISDAVNKIGEGFDAFVVHGTSDSSISLWAKLRTYERDCFEGDWVHTAACFFTRGAFESVDEHNEAMVAFED